ncbi:MAG: flavodoxin family protein [Spirochaetota bacterium]|nr:MAG: flavodoxin family protein [Spirochaetota bacterium]
MDTLLAVYGSPRKGGNSDTLMGYFLEGVERSQYKTERVFLRDLNILPCTGCKGCEKTGKCVLEDNMGGLYDKLLTYNRIVMAFPVFFLGPPAIVKTFIDRVQALWTRRHVLGSVGDNKAKREGFLLSVGGYKKSERIFSCSVTIVKAFYSACGFRYNGALLYPGVDNLHDVKRREDIKKDALRAGSEFVGRSYSNV